MIICHTTQIRGGQQCSCAYQFYSCLCVCATKIHVLPTLQLFIEGSPIVFTMHIRIFALQSLQSLWQLCVHCKVPNYALRVDQVRAPCSICIEGNLTLSASQPQSGSHFQLCANWRLHTLNSETLNQPFLLHATLSPSSSTWITWTCPIPHNTQPLQMVQGKTHQ